MLEVAILGSTVAVGGLALIGYYSLCKRKKEAEMQDKNRLMKLEPPERLNRLKKDAERLKASVPRKPYLDAALRTVSKGVLDDNEYLEVLKIFFPKLTSFDEWKNMCTSNILSRYNFRGQY
jgi:hypothetical protein